MFLFNRTPPDTAEADALFSESFAYIEQGLCYDEIGDLANALEMYEQGLERIKNAEKIKNAKKSEMYKNMIASKKNVEKRIKAIKKKGPISVPAPVENEKEKIESKEEMSDIRENLDAVGEQEAELVYFLPEGVQLFTIDGDETAAPTYPTSLQVFRFTDGDAASFKADEGEPTAFIQVGPWVYPLIKGQTPILKNEYGGYVVPNPIPDHPNMMVAILLPVDIEPRLEQEFRQVLDHFAVVREQEVKKDLTPEENKVLSKKIAAFLTSGGIKIAQNLQARTAKLATSVENRGTKYRSNKEPTEKPVPITPVIKSGVVYMHKGTKVVAKCTKFLLDKIGSIGISVGRTIASGAEKAFGDTRGGPLVSGTIDVLGGGIIGLGTVFMALEDGSRKLCRSIARETVENVRVKYGDEASDTTHHALFAAGHGSLASLYIFELGPHRAIGRVARQAGIQVVLDLQEKEKALPAPPIPSKKAE
ncbi:unnamed protein product [Auanema sp. JU1783]|nr:unnamed protein product [Auanema sp. JU1783]